MKNKFSKTFIKKRLLVRRLDNAIVRSPFVCELVKQAAKKCTFMLELLPFDLLIFLII